MLKVEKKRILPGTLARKCPIVLLKNLLNSDMFILLLVLVNSLPILLL